MAESQTECLRCGTCCTSGGPALHSEDLKLVRNGSLPVGQLITIRAGELAHNPLSGNLQPIRRELVKISGVGREWNCFYFDPDEKGCTIYDLRPKACKALKCWDTEEIEQLIEQDTLSRLDLLTEDDPMRPHIEAHTTEFPCPRMELLYRDGPGDRIPELEEQMNREILFRSRMVENYDLSVGEELFYFGRPLFHLLISVGIPVQEIDNWLYIK